MAEQTLRNRSDRIVADVLSHFRNLVLLATGPIDSSASAGQAAFSSMAMEIETKGLIKSTEDLLQLTRLLRELWVVGPLRKPGEGEKEVEATIGEEVRTVIGLLNQMREKSRQGLISEGPGQATFAQGNFTMLDSSKGEAPSQPGPR